MMVGELSTLHNPKVKTCKMDRTMNEKHGNRFTMRVGLENTFDYKLISI